MVSIDDNGEETEGAWAAEIQRRAADARANPHDEIDWRDALRDVERDVFGGKTIFLRVPTPES